MYQASPEEKQGVRPKFAIGAPFLGKTRENEYGFRIMSKWLSLTFASTTRNVGYAGNIRMKLTVELF